MTERGIIYTEMPEHWIVEVKRVVFHCPVTFEKQVSFKVGEEAKKIMRKIEPDKEPSDYIAVA